jgi:hypothetical protein
MRNFILLGIAVLLAGCTGSSDRTVRTPGPTIADQIKQVESNPNMPENQRAAIIAQLRAQEASAAGRAQAAAK